MDMKIHARVCLTNMLSKDPRVEQKISFHMEEYVAKYLEENFIEKPKKLKWVVGHLYKNRKGSKLILIKISRDEDRLIFYDYHYGTCSITEYHIDGKFLGRDCPREDIVDYWEDE